MKKLMQSTTRGTREHDRIVAVNMVRINGFTVQMVANAFSVDRSTVHDWLNAYARDGLDGLVDDARPGRPPFVPRAELVAIVGDTKRFTIYEFVELVKTTVNRTHVAY